MNMDVLVALGTSTAYIYTTLVVFWPSILPVSADERGVYFEVSAVIIAFVLVGKYMEEAIKTHSSAAVRKLMDLRPAIASVIRDGQEMEVPAESVQVGDVVVVRPGGKIPTDGTVLDPVCRMAVERDQAVSAERDGVTYYFCSRGCRSEFHESARLN
jgi:Cu+-exporting ATPase